MTVDSAGNLMAKTPQGALIAATTYLLSNQPPADDPRAALHRSTIAGLGMIGAALTPGDRPNAEKAVATRRSDRSPPRGRLATSPRQPTAGATSARTTRRRRPQRHHAAQSRQIPRGARESRVPRLRRGRRAMRCKLLQLSRPPDQDAKGFQAALRHPHVPAINKAKCSSTKSR